MNPTFVFKELAVAPLRWERGYLIDANGAFVLAGLA